MPDTRQTERERQSQSSNGAAADASMGFRVPDGGAAARGQSAEFLGAQGAAGEAEKAQAKAADEQREAAAKADWESVLGKAIGDKLFGLVKEHVDPAQLTKYAEQGTQAIAKEIGKLGDKAFKDDKAQAEALNGIMTALAPELKRLADKWLEGPSGQKIFQAISNWTEEHPRTVTTILGTAIIGAAVAAYLSNMDPPKLEKMFKLGRGFSAGGSVDLGPIQKLAIQAASATVAYQAEGLSASLTGKITKGADGKTTTTVEGQAKGQIGQNTTVDGKASVTTTDGQSTTNLEAGVESQMGKDTKGNARGTFVMNPDGTSVLKVDTGLTTKIDGRDASLGGGLSQNRDGKGGGTTDVNGRFKLGDDKQSIAADGTWNPDTRAFNLTLSRTDLDGRLRQSTSSGRDAQGQGTSSTSMDYDVDDKQSMGVTHSEGAQGATDSVRYKNSSVNGGNLGVNANASMGAQKSYGLGVTFSEGDFKAALDYEMKEGVNRLGASASYSNSDGWKAGMDLKANLDAGRFDHFGFNLGYRDPKQFRGFMLKYDAEWDAQHPGYKHAVDFTAEDVLGKIETRFSAKAGWDSQGKSNVDVGLQGAKPLNTDWRAIGGVGYRGADKDGRFQGSMYVQAGVQYKNVPIVLTFDPAEKKVMLGVTIPFGR